MGTTGSSNNMSPPPSSPPPSLLAGLSERSRESVDYLSETIQSHRPDYTNESTRQRTRTSTCSSNDEPRSQGPGPYTTFKGDEWWNQRPSAPSLSNLRPPHRESLLTYAAQMTGWQAAEGHSPPYPHHQQHHETMELPRVISQLAMANQQLAAAHGATLAHLESLYGELQRERSLRRREVPSTDVELVDEPLKKRLLNEQAHDEETPGWLELEDRIGKLEYLVTRNYGTCYSRQRSLPYEDVAKLETRIERLESLTGTQGLVNQAQCQEDVAVKIPHALHHNILESITDKVLDSSNVPEEEAKGQAPINRMDVTDGITRTDVREKSSLCDVDLHLVRSENGNTMLCSNNDQINDASREEILRLSKEIERLKNAQLKYQTTNERLLNDLAERERVIEHLVEDSKELKSRYEKAEANLIERKIEMEKLMKQFDLAKQEIGTLLKEVETSNSKRDTAEVRISTLERDLQKSRIEKEEMQELENQKYEKLKAELSEEVSDKMKQIKALEDTLNEIQRLKETTKTESKDTETEASGEDSLILESLDDPQQTLPTDRTNLDEFKKELSMKREARQRAIAAVSSEMERLRRELDAEKEAHSETSRMLELLRSAQGNSQTEVVTEIQPISEVSKDLPTDGIHKRSRYKDPIPDEHEIALKRLEALHLTNILKISDELRNDIRFQFEKIEDLRYHLERDKDQHQQRIQNLIDVTNRTRGAVVARERCANGLKDHLAQILVRLGDRSFLDCKDEIGAECERQLENINSLKCLYNERLKVLAEIKDRAVKDYADAKERLDYSLKKSECLEDDLKKADEKIDTQDTEISNLESQLGLAKADCRDLQNQMSLINGLFTQMLLGASSADMDLDRLTQLLQENHDLISDVAKEEGTEAAALPKLLLDLIEQVEGSKGPQKRGETNEGETSDEVEKKEDDLQEEDIAHNLPKVWRVLLELLSCHAVGTPSASAVSSSDPNTCYKSVDTPAGPRLVISVSKTYIRLKELILEKKHLEKEMNRMKQLNSHLEGKLGEQEKKLSTVSVELTKTWNIVDRMQAQHHQLHTHEKILRYELQQKRKMLQKLKQELEYCREKWESARQKNTNTELEWRSLRREFAARKALAVHDSFNNSAESGFSDERGDDTDEEDEEEGRIRLGPRRRACKENPRASTPDTESEQPTDTELSESKTGSPVISEPRTPTPEADGELDEIEIPTGLEEKSEDPSEEIMTPEGSPESMNPLDRALTNVIQNLINIDTRATDTGFLSPEQIEENSEHVDEIDNGTDLDKDPETTVEVHPEKKIKPENDPSAEMVDALPATSVDLKQSLSSSEELTSEKYVDGEDVKIEEPLKSSVSHVFVTTSTSVVDTMPVFSIGPIPQSTVTPSSIKSVQFSVPLVVGPSNKFFAPVFGSLTTDYGQSSDNSSISSPTNCSIKENHEVALKNRSEKSASRSPESISDSDNVSVGSSSSVETVKEFPIITSSISIASGSSEETTKEETTTSEENASSVERNESEAKPFKPRTSEEVLAAREDRLKRLEEQAQWLMKKMNATSRRSSALSTRLEELHEVYGEPPVPPPMPDVLPNRRLRTNLTELPRQVPESPPTENTGNNKEPVSRNEPESPPDNAP